MYVEVNDADLAFCVPGLSAIISHTFYGWPWLKQNIWHMAAQFKSSVRLWQQLWGLANHSVAR